MQNQGNPKGRTYRRWGVTTIIAVYLLIAVGGIVRSTGSGMGCPDWPKCFGEYIPPTEASALPANYKDIYAEKRKEKNVRLIKYMQLLGKDDLATRLKNDPGMYIEQDFNATKTWIEYINRLIGAVIGLLVLGTFVASFQYFKTKPSIFWLSLSAVLLTGFQGWIGSIVVSTNLQEGMITFHMFLAILLVMILIYTVFQAYKTQLPEEQMQHLSLLKGIAIAAFLLTFAQTILGTQVREMIDVVAMRLGESQRGAWIEAIGLKYLIHRSFSWVVLVANLALVYFIQRGGASKLLRRVGYSVLVVTLIQLLSGIGLGYFGVPPYLQPIHLLLSSVMLGQQFFVFLALQNKRVATGHKQPLEQVVSI